MAMGQTRIDRLDGHPSSRAGKCDTEWHRDDAGVAISIRGSVMCPARAPSYRLHAADSAKTDVHSEALFIRRFRRAYIFVLTTKSSALLSVTFTDCPCRFARFDQLELQHLRRRPPLPDPVPRSAFQSRTQTLSDEDTAVQRHRAFEDAHSRSVRCRAESPLSNAGLRPLQFLFDGSESPKRIEVIIAIIIFRGAACVWWWVIATRTSSTRWFPL